MERGRRSQWRFSRTDCAACAPQSPPRRHRSPSPTSSSVRGVSTPVPISEPLAIRTTSRRTCVRSSSFAPSSCTSRAYVPPVLLRRASRGEACARARRRALMRWAGHHARGSRPGTRLGVPDAGGDHRRAPMASEPQRRHRRGHAEGGLPARSAVASHARGAVLARGRPADPRAAHAARGGGEETQLGAAPCFAGPWLRSLCRRAWPRCSRCGQSALAS
jgi:hypothetical protein